MHDLCTGIYCLSIWDKNLAFYGSINIGKPIAGKDLLDSMPLNELMEVLPFPSSSDAKVDAWYYIVYDILN